MYACQYAHIFDTMYACQYAQLVRFTFVVWHQNHRSHIDGLIQKSRNTSVLASVPIGKYDNE